MTPHAHWTPASDTHELPSVVRGPRLFERDTVELDMVLDLYPGQPTRYERPPSFIDHLRASTQGAFWTAVILSGLLVGLLIGVLTRGMVMTWDGPMDVTGVQP